MVIIYSISLFIALYGYVNDEPILTCYATILFLINTIFSVLSKDSIRGINPIILYSITSIFSVYTNILTINSIGTLEESTYNIYLVKDYISDASFIIFLGLAAIVIGFNTGMNNTSIKSLLPKITTPIQLEEKINILVPIGFFLIGLSFLGIKFKHLGTIGSVIRLIPYGIIFICSKYASSKNNHSLKNIILILALSESIRALLYEYLRGLTIVPLIAFILGNIFGTKSLKPLRSIYMVPIYAILIFFVSIFGTLGKLRGSASTGLKKIENVLAFQKEMTKEDAEEERNIFSRSSTINQLTQVVRITRIDGFYNGQTLDYLLFVFIPRFLWPDKPIIAQGGWFAERIGFAYKIGTYYSNSINMTIPGELYLNFGYFGVITGGFVVGLILAILWGTTDFLRNEDGIIGLMFGFYLLQTGSTMGSDLQILITMLSVYSFLLIINTILLKKIQ